MSLPNIEPQEDGYLIGIGAKKGEKKRDLMFFVSEEDFTPTKARETFERLLTLIEEWKKTNTKQ